MRDTEDTVKIRHARIDWQMFDVKGPHSIETDDIKFMMQTGVFAKSDENLIRIDTLATRGQLLAKEKAEQYYVDQARLEKGLVSIAERISIASNARKRGQRKKRKRKAKQVEETFGPTPLKGELYETYRNRFLQSYKN